MDQISPGLQSALASWVNTKNMQPIVDKITPLIWTDINIDNADSIIVASSKPYCIGKYHNAAHMLLDTDQDELIIKLRICALSRSSKDASTCTENPSIARTGFPSGEQKTRSQGE